MRPPASCGPAAEGPAPASRSRSRAWAANRPAKEFPASRRAAPLDRTAAARAAWCTPGPTAAAAAASFLGSLVLDRLAHGPIPVEHLGRLLVIVVERLRRRLGGRRQIDRDAGPLVVVVGRVLGIGHAITPLDVEVERKLHGAGPQPHRVELFLDLGVDPRLD